MVNKVLPPHSMQKQDTKYKTTTSKIIQAIAEKRVIEKTKKKQKKNKEEEGQGGGGREWVNRCLQKQMICEYQLSKLLGCVNKLRGESDL